MAGVTEGSEDGDPRLLIITEIFRPYLVKNLRINCEFLSNLTGTGAVNIETIRREQFLESAEGVTKLLDYLSEVNNQGIYTAFLQSLRNTGGGTESFVYLADYIEGLAEEEESESREEIKQLLQTFCPRFCEINPQDVLPYIKDMSDEEKENVLSKDGNHGPRRGAFVLFGILTTKGLNCIHQLIDGLRGAGKVSLADELSQLCPSKKVLDDCMTKSSKLNDINTGIIVDKHRVFEEGTPSDDNTSGCDSLSAAGGMQETLGELNLGCTQDTSQKSNDVNINNSEDKKTHTSVKEVLSKEPTDEGDNSESTSEESPKVIPLKLRGYQEELATPSLQGKNSVVVAPTGSGKTVVAARVAKAVLDREPGVGQRTGRNSTQPVVGGSNKVIFIVNKVPLVKQQGDLFKQYIDGRRIMGLSGEMGHIGSLVDLLEKKDVLVMTAQILVNALRASDKEDNSERMELSAIGLLILDECHHCQKGNAYNEIMAEYCDLKLSAPHKARPQILGLTASMGVGKAKSRYKALSHILNLCANLDAGKLTTVQNEDNLEELKRNRDKPTEEILPVAGRRNDRFKGEIEQIMARIEEIITQTPGGMIIRRESELKCPTSRGTQVYEQWLVKMQDYIAGLTTDNDNRMCLVSCVDHLKEYNASLYINRDARTQDALEYLQSHFTRYQDHEDMDEQEEHKDENYSYEDSLVALFKEKEDDLRAISRDPANKNPLLNCLSETLIKALAGKDQSRGILFCKTRAATEALLAWMEKTPNLQFLKPGRLIGSGGTGMTQKQQTELLTLFRDGNHQLIVATSVAEEGLDIQACNVVIRYNYISNDIGRVQAQGRNRARGGKFYLIVTEELNLHEREIMNQIREQMMLDATQNLQKMSEKDFLEQIEKLQKENKLERKLKNHRNQTLKHNKKLMEVHLICRKCGIEACTADDIRRIEGAHHVVLADFFSERCKFVDMPHRSPYPDMEFRQKIFCGNSRKSCPQEWGTQMLYKGCLVNLISPGNFVMKLPKGPPRKFKKWKDVPFQITDMSLDELEKICNLSSGDEEEEVDEEIQVDEEEDEADEAEDTRGNGDGMEMVTMVNGVQPHHSGAASNYD